MLRYRNVRTGRILERPTADEWLEASAGWERMEEPKPKASAKDKQEEETD